MLEVFAVFAADILWASGRLVKGIGDVLWDLSDAIDPRDHADDDSSGGGGWGRGGKDPEPDPEPDPSPNATAPEDVESAPEVASERPDLVDYLEGLYQAPAADHEYQTLGETDGS